MERISLNESEIADAMTAYLRDKKAKQIYTLTSITVMVKEPKR